METQPDTQKAALKPSQERFITDQLAGMEDMGFAPSALAREESALRSGMANNNLIAGFFDHIMAGAGGLK